MTAQRVLPACLLLVLRRFPNCGRQQNRETGFHSRLESPRPGLASPFDACCAPVLKRFPLIAKGHLQGSVSRIGALSVEHAIPSLSHVYTQAHRFATGTRALEKPVGDVSRLVAPATSGAFQEKLLVAGAQARARGGSSRPCPGAEKAAPAGELAGERRWDCQALGRLCPTSLIRPGVKPLGEVLAAEGCGRRKSWVKQGREAERGALRAKADQRCQEG